MATYLTVKVVDYMALFGSALTAAENCGLMLVLVDEDRPASAHERRGVKCQLDHRGHGRVS